MTVFAYALYQYASRLMMPEEREDAQHLAAKADAGDREAAKLLRMRVLFAIRYKGNKKALLSEGFHVTD